jgi:hypothetical protein
MKLLVTHDIDASMSSFFVRLEDFFLRILILAIFGVWYE